MAAITVTLEAIDPPLEAGRGFDDEVPAPADSGDVQRLRDLLGKDEPAADGPVQQVQGAGVDGKPLSTLGDAILRQMEEISHNYRERKAHAVKSVDEQATGGGPGRDDHKTVFKLLALQMQLAESTLEVELISKGVSKFVSTVDQLSKLQ